MNDEIKHQENMNRIAQINSEIEPSIKMLCVNIVQAIKDENDIVIMNVIGQSLFTYMSVALTSLELPEMFLKITMTMLLSYLQKAVVPHLRESVIEQIHKDLLENMYWNIERDGRKKGKLH